MTVAENSIEPFARSVDRATAGNVNAKVSNSKGIKRAMTSIPIRYQRNLKEYHLFLYRAEPS